MNKEKKVTQTNKITCSVGETLTYIKRIISVGGFRQSVYLEGPSGIGKSEMAVQLAKDLDAELIDIRLGNLDTIALNGIGIPDIETMTAFFTRPEFFPPEKSEKKYILLLDEFNHASEEVFGAAYQLVLERRMGTHTLPDNIFIIAAGNSIDDKGIAFNLPSPLVNRFMKFNIVPNYKDWLKYAESIDIDWRILSFIKNNTDLLHNFNPKSEEDNFPTPRNWVKLNPYVQDEETLNDQKFLKVIMNSMFGHGVMIQFMTFLQITNKLPMISDIIEEKKVPLLSPDLNSSYSFSMLVKSYLKINIDEIKSSDIMKIFDYTNNQNNNEVMQMLNLEILSIINKSGNKKLHGEVHYLINSIQPEKLEKNKKFTKKMSDFYKTMEKV